MLDWAAERKSDLLKEKNAVGTWKSRREHLSELKPELANGLQALNRILRDMRVIQEGV